jgi:hypothetical protein
VTNKQDGSAKKKAIAIAVKEFDAPAIDLEAWVKEYVRAVLPYIL